MTEKQKKAIEKHGQALNAIFNTKFDAISLCKKLHRIECQAHRMAENYCNGDIDNDEWGTYTDKTIDRLNTILGFRQRHIPVFINGDPRGYALKIRESYQPHVQIHKDWGGYIILAPEIGQIHKDYGFSYFTFNN